MSEVVEMELTETQAEILAEDKRVSIRSKIFALEAAMLREPSVYASGGERDIDDLCPVKHHFSQGVYAREMFIPKGTVLTGKIHKYEQLNIMSQGELSVLTEDGIKRVKAPFTIVSPPGTKRVAYAHEDTIWTTIHGTDETDLEKLEAHFVAQSEQEYISFCKALEHKEPEK